MKALKTTFALDSTDGKLTLFQVKTELFTGGFHPNMESVFWNRPDIPTAPCKLRIRKIIGCSIIPYMNAKLDTWEQIALTQDQVIQFVRENSSGFLRNNNTKLVFPSVRQAFEEYPAEMELIHIGIKDGKLVMDGIDRISHTEYDPETKEYLPREPQHSPEKKRYWKKQYACKTYYMCERE